MPNKVLIDRDTLKELIESYESVLDADEMDGYMITNEERELVSCVKKLLS